MSLFEKYPFPCWIPAGCDELIHRAVSLWSSVWVKSTLRWQKCKVGSCLIVDGKPIIRMQRPGSIEVGANVTINVRPMSNLAGISQRTILHCIHDGKIELRDGCGLSGVVLSSRSRIHVGQRVNLGVNVRIYDHDFHSLNHEQRTDRRTDQANIVSAPVLLGDDVFVGANAIILKGVSIGARSIVAAGSVVIRGDYPEDSLIAGNPAAVVKALA